MSASIRVLQYLRVLQAATRGDGKVGEDVLCAARHMLGIPQTLPAGKVAPWAYCPTCV